MEESHRKEFREESEGGYLEKGKQQSRLPQDVTYVAVGEDVSQDGPTLKWALNRFKGHKICIFHVRQPSVRDASASGRSYKMPIAGGERGKRDMPEVLDYLKIAKKSGVDIEILYHENDSTLTGILQFINLHNVERLVMGGGATSLTTSEMLPHAVPTESKALSKSDKPQREIPRLRSTKAKYVNQVAPSFCRIWFVSNGDLLFTRELGAGMFGLDRLIKAENIQNPFLFFFLASFRLQVASSSYEFGVMDTYLGRYGKHDEITGYLKRLGDLLSALTEVIAAGRLSSHQFYKVKKSSLLFMKYFLTLNGMEEFCSAIQSILQDRPQEKFPNYQKSLYKIKYPYKKKFESKKLSMDEALVSSKRGKPPIKSDSSIVSTISDDLAPEKNPINYLQSTSLLSSTFSKTDFLYEMLGSSQIKGEARKVHDEVLNISEIPLYLVPLLAYCSLFPKGHTLVRESLVNMWIAEGFLLPVVDNLNDREVINTWYTNKDGKLDDIGNQYFEELLLRGVFQEPIFFGGTVYSCQIHPLAHDVASRIAAQELIIRELYSKRTTGSYLVVNNIDNDPPMFSYDDMFAMINYDSCVRTCLLFGTIDARSLIQRGFFNNLEYMQVLDLYRIQVEELPFFFNLKYLGLSGNREIKKLRQSFRHLQTLAADGCIQLNHCIDEKSIQNLYLTTKQTRLEFYRSSRIQMLELSHCMELRSIRLPFKKNSIRRLRIYDCPRLVLIHDDELYSLLDQVEELIIDSCLRLDLSGIQNMTCLRHLELKGLPRLVTLPVGLQSATSLEYFMIADCRRFKNTVNVLQNLKSLKKLCIYSCPALLALSECAPTLQTLDIRSCPTLIETCLTNKGQNWQVIRHIPYIILDGTCSKRQKSGFLKDGNTADIPQFGAEGDLYFSASISYFDLKAKISGIGKVPLLTTMQSKPWRILALVLKATSCCRIKLKELHKNIEAMKLHCLLFPEDYEFERDTIIQLWMAAGFLRSRRKEEVGMRCFNILVDQQYIWHSRIDLLTGKGMYKVNVPHAINHSSRMINSAYKDQYLILKNNHREEADVSNARHVCVVSNNNPIDETTLKVLQTNRELKTLMFITPNGYASSLKQVPDGMFLDLPDLQALDLSRSQITNLPTSIGNVTSLSYLDVSFTLIEKLPESIQHLTKLQTLKLKGCEKLYTLPNGLTKLVSLRHLEFDAVRRLTGMPKGISALTELRTLSTFIVGSTEEDSDIDELWYLKNICGSLSIHGLERMSDQYRYPSLLSDKRITHLQLKWGTGFETSSQSSLSTGIHKAFNILCSLEPNDECIEELHILSFPGSKLPHWGFMAFEKLVHMTLLKCENTILNTYLGIVPNLKHLSITQMNRVTEISDLFHAHLVGFPKLEVLEMDGMLGLKSWTGIRRQDLPLLRKLIVMHCPELKELYFLPFLGSLKYLKISSCEAFESLPDTLPRSLETLMINDCPKLKPRCLENEDDWSKIKHVPLIWIDSQITGKVRVSHQWRILSSVLRLRFKLNEAIHKNVEDLKLHCLLFPEDYEFERDTIIQLWMAAGFLRSRRKEEIGMRCFNMLEHEEYICFLRIDILTGKSMYKVNIVKVTSHNPSGMINGANKDQYLILKNNHTEAADVSNARHVCVVSNNNPIDETTLKVLQINRELKTLMFITPNGYGSSLKQVPDGLFLALPDLQALDLSRTQITNLPTSIGNVTSLSYLDVSFTLIEKLPESIQHLTKLQMLKLKGCEKLYTLPKGLTKLVSLRHLEFDAVRRLTGMPKGISSLTELRTLSTFIVGNTEEDSNINELKYLKNLCGSLSIHGLERVSKQYCSRTILSDKWITHLQLKWGTGFEPSSQNSLSTGIQEAFVTLWSLEPNDECIEELHILSFPGSIFPQWMGSMSSEKLVRITLLKCENTNLNTNLGDVPNLKYLSITQMNQVTEISKLFYEHRVGFPKLEVLEMDGMLGLKSWTGIRRQDLPLLRKLIVMHCPELKELYFLPFLGSLKYLKISSCEAFESLPDALPESLETLMINDCPMLEPRCLENGDDWDKIKHVPNIWIDEVDIRSSGEQTSDEDETHITDSDIDDGSLNESLDLVCLSKDGHTHI